MAPERVTAIDRILVAQILIKQFTIQNKILIDKSNYKMRTMNSNESSFFNQRLLRPVSDAVLHMSRIELSKLSSCEVRRLNQFGTAY